MARETAWEDVPETCSLCARGGAPRRRRAQGAGWFLHGTLMSSIMSSDWVVLIGGAMGTPMPGCLAGVSRGGSPRLWIK